MSGGASTTKMKSELRGVFNIVLTPFRADWSIDVEGLGINIESAIASGVDGLLVGGSYGEFPSLSTKERTFLFKEAVQITNGRVPVLVCTAHSSTLECLRLTQNAQELGADGAMTTPPYVTEVSDKEIVRHVSYIVNRCELGIVLYNNPGIGRRFSLDVLDHLADLPGVVGLKQGTTSLSEMTATQSLLGDRIAVFCGSDTAMLSALAEGMIGVTSTNSSFIADIILETHRRAMANNWEAARRSHRRWASFRRFARRVGQPASAKAAMDIVGLRGGRCRPPLAELSEREREELVRILRNMGV